MEATLRGVFSNSRKLMILTVLFAGAAHADWQYTTWGMTPEQVIAASRGQVGPYTSAPSSNTPKPTDPVVKAKGLYQAGSYKFTAVFSFDPSTNGLVKVELLTEDHGRINELLKEVQNNYGPPEKKQTLYGMTISTWRDQENQNRVEAFYMRSGAVPLFSLAYEPLKTSASGKL